MKEGNPPAKKVGGFPSSKINQFLYRNNCIYIYICHMYIYIYF